MGMFNVIKTEWECPFCHTRQDAEIQIKYGAKDTIHSYAVGDKIDWIANGFNNDDRGRAPNGTGVIFGVTACKNSWTERIPKPYLPDPKYRGFDPRTHEAIARHGCPQMMNVLIDLDGFVIQRVHFSSDLEVIFDDL